VEIAIPSTKRSKPKLALRITLIIALRRLHLG
jgi:hypothetical protein